MTSYIIITLRCLSTPPHAEDGSVPSGRELMGDHLERFKIYDSGFLVTRMRLTSAPQSEP